MKLKVLLAILISMQPYLLIAQQIHYSIAGHIKDIQGRAVPSVMLTLIRNNDSAIASSCISDEEGSYRLTIMGKGSYSIKADAVGFASEIQTIEIVDLQHILDFVLKENKELSEVIITSHKPLMEYKVDRTVFNIENSISVAGSDAWDALKKTPGVVIVQNQVTIPGRNSVGVMINGKLQQLSGDDLVQFLRSIPSDYLSKIEIITTPAAKYDAEGSGGLINIITKKSLKNGLNGNVTLSYNRNTYNSPAISTTVNYKMDKLSVFSTVGLGVSASKSNARTTSYFSDQRWEQVAYQGLFNKYARLRVIAEYNLSKKSVIGIQISKVANRVDNTEDISSAIFGGNNTPDSVIRTNGETHEIYPGKHTINANYVWNIDTTGKRLNLNVDYHNQTTDKKRDFEISNQLYDGQVTGHSANRIIANPAIAIQSVIADLEWPVKIARFTFGAKASVVNNGADNNYYTQAGVTYVADLPKTNSFNYREEIQALYTTAQKKIGKCEVQFGLRGEHTTTIGYSSTIGQTNKNDYTKIFPSGYIQYAPNGNHSFSFSTARRIARPRYAFLNPFRFYYTPHSYTEGNPNLQPELTTLLDFSYIYKLKYSIKIFTKITTNSWEGITEIDSIAGTSNFTYKNIGNGSFSGINTSVTLNPAQWWECVLALNWGYNFFKTHQNATTTYNAFYASIGFNNSLYLNKQKTLSAELNGYYNTPRVRDLRRWQEVSCINIGIRLLLMDKNIILTLDGNDIMAKAYWQITNLSNATREYYYDDERSVRFSATYKFGNKTIKKRGDHNMSEEIQRADQ